MATEEEKKYKLMRVMGFMITGMSTTLWDLFGDTALAAMQDVGKNILQIMENEMGLETAGEDPKTILMEIGRIFEDETGLMESFEIDEYEGGLSIMPHNCMGWALATRIMESGVVEYPYICPLMNVTHAAFLRMGHLARRSVTPVPDVKGCRINFEFVE